MKKEKQRAKCNLNVLIVNIGSGRMKWAKNLNSLTNMEEIIKGNALIFDFMGMEHIKDNEIIESHRMKSLSYHYEWSQLMPVVEKISRIEFERRYDEDLEKWVIWTHHPVTFGMLDENGRPMVRFYCNTLHFGDTLIQATWNAVVDFIEKNNSHLNNK